MLTLLTGIAVKKKTHTHTGGSGRVQGLYFVTIHFISFTIIYASCHLLGGTVLAKKNCNETDHYKYNEDSTYHSKLQPSMLW